MKTLVLLMVCGAFCSASDKLFYDSAITLLRPSDHATKTEFGFSMAYQDISGSAQLVVGAPRQDAFGQVYSCPLVDVSKDIDCSIVDIASYNEIKSVAKKTKGRPDTRLFGFTLAATSSFFLTCAPFWSREVSYLLSPRNRKTYPYDNIYGSCFLHNTTTTKYSQWSDNAVRFDKKLYLTSSSKGKSIVLNDLAGGGLGCSTLADTENGYLLIAKTAYISDILYVDINNPLALSNSLVEDYYDDKPYLRQYYNLGYGMAVGNFFHTSTPIYAVSVSHSEKHLKGGVIFLEKTGTSRKLDIMQVPGKNAFTAYFIKNEDVGFMFGYALAAADINQDGFSELLVGAPGQSKDESVEFGALHIYLGGNIDFRSEENQMPMRSIYADKERGRFGSAIAKSDIDGDNIPEIFVSAPYEDSGAVYMISGHELNLKLVAGNSFKRIQLSELDFKQKFIGRSPSLHYGFSLQIIKDIDNNGCDELAVGSPGTSSVELIRCLPAVNTTITLELLNTKIVKEEATDFTMRVCLSVTLNPKCSAITGSLWVSSFVTGDTSISKNKFEHKMTKKQKDEHCENILVEFVSKKPITGRYTFTTKVSVDENPGREAADYQPWVVLSSQSQREKNLTVDRYCGELYCQPELTVDINWLGNRFIDAGILSPDETFNIELNNTGHKTHEPGLRITVQGSQISALTKQCYKENEGNVYLCSVPNMEQDSSILIPVTLNTTEIVNVPSVIITVEAFDKGFNDRKYDSKEISIPYQFDPASVVLKGSNHNFTITDAEMKNSDIITDSYNHEFSISNKGYVTWDLIAVLELKNEPYFKNIKIVTTEVCQQQTSNDNEIFKFRCKLHPECVAKIIANIEILKDKIISKITKENIEINSEMSIDLLPTSQSLKAKSSTKLHYRKILTVGNDQTLVIIIVVIVALILLVAFVIVLYKCGFFKRTQKQKLSELRESVRKRSVRMASESSKGRKPSSAEEPPCEMEVEDDCVFTEVDISPAPQTSKDDAVLINDVAK